MSCTYRFMDSSSSKISCNNKCYDIIQRQQPRQAKISLPNDRDKRGIEPPPILQMKWINCTLEEQKKSLQSPFYFMVVNIVKIENENIMLPTPEYLSGSTVSSLYRLRDIDNIDGGFFVFGDLAVKKHGRYKLHFSLFELIEDKVENRKTVYSNAFTVYTSKTYPGAIESTFLSRTFSDQGIKIRVRKENRSKDDDLKRTNSRKRKCDSLKIIPKEIVCSPSYASDNVYFGRWQASNHKSRKQAALPSPTPSISSPTSLPISSPTLPSISSPTLPPISSIPNNIELQEKWMMLDDDNYICNRLPPLREILTQNHSYSPFPIDNSFFNRRN